MEKVSGRKPGRLWAFFVATVVAAVGIAAGGAPAVWADSDGLSIELNKAEDVEGNCIASLVIENLLGKQLDRFNLDLFVFDSKGVISRQVLLDLAPLRKDKTTVARFVLTDDACADTAKVLVNDIPACRASDGQELDCLKNLAVFSRSRIQLVK